MCTWTWGALLRWPQPWMSAWLPFPAGLAPPRCSQGQVLCSACSSPSSFLSEAQLSLQLGGGKEGWELESRSQAAAWVHCSRTEEQGGRRPEPAGFMRHYMPSLSYSGPAPLPLRSSRYPAPPGPLEGALRSHTSFRPCPWAQWPHVRPWTRP